MRNFLMVLSNGWQSVKETMSEYFNGKPTTAKPATTSPQNPVELHTFEEELPHTETMYKQFMRDFDDCCAKAQALHAAKKPMNNEQLEQIKKLFEDYFKVVNIAKKERNTEIQSKVQNMFIKMTNIFNMQNITLPTAAKQSSMKTTLVKPLTPASAVSPELSVRTANL